MYLVVHDSYIPLMRTVPTQEGRWECGYLVCAYIMKTDSLLRQRPIGVCDRDKRFASLSKCFDFKTELLTRLKAVIEKYATNFENGDTKIKSNRDGPNRKKKYSTPTKDNSTYVGKGAPTPSRHQKAR